MQSEPNNIDDLFRKKEEESQPDLSKMKDHWQDMRSQLPGSKPEMNFGKYLVPVAASVLLIASTVLVTKHFYSDKPQTGVVKNPSETQSVVVSERPGSVDTGGKSKIAVTQPEQTVHYGSRLRVPTLEEMKKMAPVDGLIYSIDTLLGATTDTKVTTTISESAKDDIQVIREFLSAFKPTVQSFTIDNAKDTLLTCKEGTSLFIRAGSFETINGNPVTASVHVQITEHYNFADMVANKLTTTSGGNRLVTAGMIHIQATSAKQELKVKNGKSLDLKMPGKVDPRMELFTGEAKTVMPDEEFTRTPGILDSGVNWVARGQQQLYYDPVRKNINVFNLGNYPETRYREKVRLFTREVTSSKSIATFYLPFDSKYSKAEMKKMLEEKYSRYYDKIKVRQDWKPISRKKQQMESSVVREWGSPYVGDSVRMPIKWATKLKYITVDDSIMYEERWKKELEDRINRNRSYNDYLDKTAEYNFRITSLGWINCDRFLNYPRSRTTEFVINTGIVSNSMNYSAMLIFKGENSVMPCYVVNGKIRTGRVPLGDAVTFVGMTVKDGKVYTCVKDLIITKKEADGLEFKPSTPEEFKKQLMSLGSVIKG